MVSPSERTGGDGPDELPRVGEASGAPHVNGAEAVDEGDEPFMTPTDDFSVFSFVLLALLAFYTLVGASVLLLSAYSLSEGWTLYGGQPYWAVICWPVGAVGLLTPPIMKLDEVTEMKRTPPVTRKAVAAYGIATAGYVVGALLSFHPVGLAGAVATVVFTGLCAQYVWER